MLARPTSRLWVDSFSLPHNVPRGRWGFTAGARQAETFAERTARRGSPRLGVCLGLWECFLSSFLLLCSLVHDALCPASTAGKGCWLLGASTQAIARTSTHRAWATPGVVRLPDKGDRRKNQSQDLRPTLSVRSGESLWLSACNSKSRKDGACSPFEFFLCNFQNPEELQSIIQGNA